MKDAVSRLGRTARRGVRTIGSPSGLRGTVVEAAWVMAHLATYPLGVAQEKARESVDRFTLEGLPPLKRGLLVGDVEAAGTPILLVHGIMDNRSIFTLLRRRLHRRGFAHVTTMNYQVITQDIRAAAHQLAATVEMLCDTTGYERIHVIGHSLGGVIARYYVQRLGGDARVHTLVTLGSPHAGTQAARLLPQRVVRQLVPGSDLMRELAQPVEACRTRFVAFWSDLDSLIVPKRNARLAHGDLHVRNVFVRGVGHMSLPIHGHVVHEICTTLAVLDHDGSTVTSGVTPIDNAGSLVGRPAWRPAPRRTAAPSA